MSSALSIAATGIYSAVSRATRSANNIVNASSTGADITSALLNIKADSEDVGADAAVIRTEEKNQKVLLDIKV